MKLTLPNSLMTIPLPKPWLRPAVHLPFRPIGARTFSPVQRETFRPEVGVGFRRRGRGLRLKPPALMRDRGPDAPKFRRCTAQLARAFTLIELLLVLVILGILAAIVVPKFSGRTEQARVTAAQSQIATFGTALDAFEIDNGYYPKGKNGLLELVQQPREAQNWRGPYLKGDIPTDPWGNPYIYEFPGKNNPNSYDLMSMGADGRVGGDDDVTNWSQTKR